MNDLETKLTSIRVKPLSDSERHSSWANISMRMADTPTISPFSFAHFARGFATVALTLIVIVFGGRVTDQAIPGDALYPLDRSFERTFLSVLPDNTQSRVLLSQAEERGNEIAMLIANESSNVEQSAETADDSAISAKMAPAPTADTMMMATFATESAKPEKPTYSEATEHAIEVARQEFAELETLFIEANNQEALNRLREIQAAFEAQTQSP